MMDKKDALSKIEDAATLEEKFNASFEVLKHSPPVSQDKMLILYAYYKQAVFGNYTSNNDTNSFKNYIQTFKNNAWSQVYGMSRKNAMKEYVNFTKRLILEEF